MRKGDVRIDDLDNSERYALTFLYGKDTFSPGIFKSKWKGEKIQSGQVVRKEFHDKDWEGWGNSTRLESTHYKYEHALMDLERKGLVKAHYDAYKRGDGSRGVESYFEITKKGQKLAKEIEESKEGGLVPKVTASVFLLAGLFFMILPGFSTTGNVIGSSSGADISFFLSFALMIIGGVLLFQNLK